MSAHMMAATFLKSPELALQQSEADALAGAIAEVEKHYSVSLSPETRAWLGLATVGAMIYGPRAYLISKRRKAEKGPAKPAAIPTPAISPAPKGDAPAGEGPAPKGLSPADFGL